MARNIYDVPAEAVRSITREQHEANLEREKLLPRAQRMQHKYGIPADSYLSALATQAGCCAGCRTPESEMWFKLEPDFNPVTRRLYALFCKPCSQVLATAKRDPALLRALADHAERSAKE